MTSSTERAEFGGIPVIRSRVNAKIIIIQADIKSVTEQMFARWSGCTINFRCVKESHFFELCVLKGFLVFAPLLGLPGLV